MPTAIWIHRATLEGKPDKKFPHIWTDKQGETHIGVRDMPERRHLFISGSDSHDPAKTARTPSATLRVVEVAVPGAGAP